MGPPTEPGMLDDGLAFSWRQGVTVLLMVGGVAIVGVLVSMGLRAWKAYDARSDREAMVASMAPGFQAWTLLEREHGYSNAPLAVRDVDGSPGPDAEGRGHWLEVVTLGRPSDLASRRGVVLEVDERGQLHLAEAHRALPDRIRAESAEDVGWVVFTRLARLDEAYFFETHPVAIERLETRLVGIDGVVLANAAAESLPPSFVPREPAPPDAYPLPPELTVRLTRRMVDAVAALPRHADGAEGTPSQLASR
ncbi:MAG: hypothetical protein AB8I08_15385 [Sandaracinaceae bacterium]